MAIELRVNGGSHVVDAAPDTPLLDVLRNQLGIDSPSFGCGSEWCGCCSVLLDKREARSCTTRVGDVGDREVTTLEGLASLWRRELGVGDDAEVVHPLQASWQAEEVPHCGYCQSGVLIQAAGLLFRDPWATTGQVRDAIDGLCRCGTYPAILRAVRSAGQTIIDLDETVSDDRRQR